MPGGTPSRPRRGRIKAVLVSLLSLERLQRSVEILSRSALGDLTLPLGEGLALNELIEAGERALTEERLLAARDDLAAVRRRAEAERAALRPETTPTLEQFLESEGLDRLVLRSGPDAER